MAQTERSVEIPWLVAHLGRADYALDIGCVESSYLDALTASTHFSARGVDTREPLAPLPGRFLFWRGDCLAMPAEWAGLFDLVTCVSVIDHIGLEAYGNPASGDGALMQAAAEMRRVTVPGGRLLLTTPYGRDLVTTHPNGGQRVLSLETLYRLYPPLDWNYVSVDCWRLDAGSDSYLPVDYLSPAAQSAGYADYRAEACLALELRRK